jgi:hypothetical protein
MLAERFGIDLEAEREHIVFAGDSPNDEPMFGYFPHAVGVANVLAFRDRMRALPAWITPSRAGAGFVELAQHLLAARALSALASRFKQVPETRAAAAVLLPAHTKGRLARRAPFDIAQLGLQACHHARPGCPSR